jgi:hypothetical protein
VEETLKVDKDLHCYIVGPKGATIKQLQADTGSFSLAPALNFLLACSATKNNF